MINLVIVFVFGLVTGSFLNSVVYSLETGKNLFKSRSHCPECKHDLSFWDLVPLLSFISLGRRCRYCRKKISWQYPLVELGTALVFLAVFIHFSFNLWSLVYHLLLSCLLIVLFIYDLKHYLLPDKVMYPALVLVAVGGGEWRAGLAFALFFAAVHFLSKGEWLGFGDVKLALLLGLALGPVQTAVSFFTAVMSGALVGSLLVLLKKKGWRSRVPFGPFLIIGFWVSLFWGGWLIRVYLDIIKV